MLSHDGWLNRIVDHGVYVERDPSAERLAAYRRLLWAAFDDFSETDFANAVGGTHVVIDIDDVVVAHAAVVARSIEVAGRDIATGYVEAVATDPRWQGRGLGTAVMRRVDAVLRNGFAMGALSTGRHAFYERLGWERWQGPTYVRGPDGPLRTPDEDDGIMVLRFGTSESLDLTAPISCKTRPGDDW